jgi:flagellar M-ring protein FliF
MADRLRGIPGRLKEWWDKFSKVQRMLIVSSVTVVAVALGILAFVLSRPNMVTVLIAEDTKKAAQAESLLVENDITPEVSADGLTLKVDKSQEARVALLLGENDITSTVYDLENVFEGGFSTTEADKIKKYQLYLERKLEDQLEEQDAIDAASITLNIPAQDGTILAKEQESSANVVLTLNDEISEAQAEGYARSIAAALHNKSAESILILSTTGDVLYMGADSGTVSASASGNIDAREKAINQVKSSVKELLLSSQVYDNVSVAPNLTVQLDEVEVQNRRYYVDDPETNRGPLDSEKSYTSESTGGVAAEPGTDANDGVGNVIQDNATTESAINDIANQYKTSEELTNTRKATGGYDPATSTISLIVTSYQMYNEATMSDNGELGDQTFEQFAEANKERVKGEVDPDFITSVSMATGIPEENISMVAYEVPFFEYDDSTGIEFMDLLPIILAALIMLMLGFVVFRSTRKDPAQVLAEELSVEALLESTKEAQEEKVEDISFAEKSESRVMLEKFVEENPEAVASLLRNWLNEEWE